MESAATVAAEPSTFAAIFFGALFLIVVGIGILFLVAIFLLLLWCCYQSADYCINKQHLHRGYSQFASRSANRLSIQGPRLEEDSVSQ